MTKSSLVDKEAEQCVVLFFCLLLFNLKYPVKTPTLLSGQSQGDFLTTDKLQHKSVVNQ